MDSAKSNDKKYLTWSKSIEKDGFYKRVEVNEIENGFLVCLNEHGEKDGKYIDSYKKYYSQTNPLDDLAPDEVDGVEKIKETIKDFLDY